jgi:hypothetical protein
MAGSLIYVEAIFEIARLTPEKSGLTINSTRV